MESAHDMPVVRAKQLLRLASQNHSFPICRESAKQYMNEAYVQRQTAMLEVERCVCGGGRWWQKIRNGIDW
jgi:hypothetical protein